SGEVVRSIARPSSPSMARPTTEISLVSARSDSSPSRTRVWSSTISTRILFIVRCLVVHGEPGSHQETAIGSPLARHGPAQLLEALPHGRETKSVPSAVDRSTIVMRIELDAAAIAP